MKRIMLALALTLFVAAAPFAQTNQAQVPPPTQTPVPTPTPAATPVPFPAEAKLAYIDFQRIVNESKLGQQGMQAMKALDEKLSKSLAAKNEEIKAQQEKIKQQQNLVSDAVLQGLARDLDRMMREAQFQQQDADVQRGQLQEELLRGFQAKVIPIVEEIRNERGLWMVFAVGVESNLAAAHPGLDLTADVIKRLDSGAK